MNITQTKRSGKKRLIIAAGALLGIAALATSAAFTDIANVNLGSGTDGGGLGGSNNRFNIQVAATDDEGNPVVGEWQEADTPEGVNYNVVGADLLAPGGTASVTIPFRNESPVLGAAMTFTLQDRSDTASDTVMSEALRYSVLVGTSVVVSNATQAEVNALTLGTFAAGDEDAVRLVISLPDQGSDDANNALQAKVAYVQAHFDASSVVPAA